MADYINVLMNSILGSDGTPLASGRVTITPTNGKDQPMPFRIGTATGQATLSPVTRPIVNGEIVGSLRIANPAVTDPVSVKYRIEIVDLTIANPVTTRYSLVTIAADPSGNWNFSSMDTSAVVGTIPMQLIPGIAAPNFQGAWSNTATYAVGYSVTYLGSSYVSLQNNNIGNEPDLSASWWAVLAQKGDTGTLSPSATAMMNFAFDYSKENSELATVGNSSVTPNQHVAENNAFGLPEPLPQGLLTSITANIFSLVPGSGLTFYLLTKNDAGLYFVADSFTVFPSATGLQTFSAGAAFDPREIQAGQYLGIFSSGAMVGYNSAGSDGYLAYPTAGAQPNSTPATWLVANNFTFSLSVSVRVFVQPSSLAPALQQKLDHAYNFSLANSSPTTVGTTSAGINFGVDPRYTYALPKPMKAGLLQSVSLKFFSVEVAAPVVMYILTQTAPGMFSVARSFQLTMAAVNTVQTFAGGVDFPFIEVQEGQYLGYFSAHGNIGYASSPSTGYLAILGQPDATGTPQAWTSSPQFTFALSATVLAYVKPLSAADGAYLVSAGRTLLDRQTFAGPYIPPSWTQVGGWTVASGGGLVSPAASPSFSKPAYSNAFINAERRTYAITFELLAAASIFAVYSALIDPMDGTFGSQIVVDSSANTLAINHTITAPALTSGTAISTPLGFSPAPSVKYTILIQMDRRMMTVSIADPITGTTAQLVSGSNEATNVDEIHGGAAGLMLDSLGFQCPAGQIKVDAYSIYADAKYPRALFWGDSITHGSGVKVYERWAQLVANKTGNCVISAHGGCSSNNCVAKIPTELQTLRPEYLVMMIGSNDAFPGNLGLATWQANVSTVIAAAAAQGTKVVLCTLPPRYDIAQSTINAFNAWLFSLTGVTLVRMDRALTIGNDGITQNTALYIDGVHPNPAGSILMANRFAIDVPSLFDAAVISAQAVMPLPFVGSGPEHAAGVVPDPGSIAGTSRFLREDGGWAIPLGAISSIYPFVSLDTGMPAALYFLAAGMQSVVASVAGVPFAITFIDTVTGLPWTMYFLDDNTIRYIQATGPSGAVNSITLTDEDTALPWTWTFAGGQITYTQAAGSTSPVASFSAIVLSTGAPVVVSFKSGQPKYTFSS